MFKLKRTETEDCIQEREESAWLKLAHDVHASSSTRFSLGRNLKPKSPIKQKINLSDFSCEKICKRIVCNKSVAGPGWNYSQDGKSCICECWEGNQIHELEFLFFLSRFLQILFVLWRCFRDSLRLTETHYSVIAIRRLILFKRPFKVIKNRDGSGFQIYFYVALKLKLNRPQDSEAFAFIAEGNSLPVEPSLLVNSTDNSAGFWHQ